MKNIGSKIKKLAKLIFVIGTIGSIVAGFILMSTVDLLYYLIAIFGPVIAFVSTWIIYAFGELVEKTSANESNTWQILSKLNEKSS